MTLGRELGDGGNGLKDGVEPLVEKACGGIFESGGVLEGCGAEVGGGDVCMTQFAGVAYVPALQALGGDLGMELQGQGVVSDGEGLVVVEFCFCEVERAGGEIESIAMPVEDGQTGGDKRSEPCGRIGVGGGLERGPADFGAALAGVDARAESRGHELSAETDAEDGFLGFDAAGDEGDFVL